MGPDAWRVGTQALLFGYVLVVPIDMLRSQLRCRSESSAESSAVPALPWWVLLLQMRCWCLDFGAGGGFDGPTALVDAG